MRLVGYAIRPAHETAQACPPPFLGPCCLIVFNGKSLIEAMSSESPYDSVKIKSDMLVVKADRYVV